MARFAYVVVSLIGTLPQNISIVPQKGSHWLYRLIKTSLLDFCLCFDLIKKK